jgi:hypothetical protein
VRLSHAGIRGAALVCARAILTACSGSGGPAAGVPLALPRGAPAVLGSGTLYLNAGNSAFSANLWRIGARAGPGPRRASARRPAGLSVAVQPRRRNVTERTDPAAPHGPPPYGGGPCSRHGYPIGWLRCRRPGTPRGNSRTWSPSPCRTSGRIALIRSRSGFACHRYPWSLSRWPSSWFRQRMPGPGMPWRTRPTRTGRPG